MFGTPPTGGEPGDGRSGASNDEVGQQASERPVDPATFAGDGQSYDVEIAHAIPGRVRLRIPSLNEDVQIERSVRRRLGELDMLVSAEVNPRSCSLILQCRPSDHEALTAALPSLFPSLRDGRMNSPQSAREEQARSTRDVAAEIEALLARLNRGARQATGGVDLKVAIPLALMALAAIGLIAGAVRRGKLPVPNWYELLWFGFNTFVILNLTLNQQQQGFEDTSPDRQSAG